MNKKLIAIDLDGTLLRSDCTISERNRKTIEKAMDKGHLIVPCTGRCYINTLHVLENFPVMPYYINANGSTITRGNAASAMHSSCIPYETGCKIYKLAKGYQTFIEIYHGLNAYDSLKGCENIKNGPCSQEYRTQLLSTNIHMEDLDCFILKEKHLVSKFHIICTNPSDIPELKSKIAQLPGIRPISTEYFNIEATYDGWSKRDGLKWLCEKIGIARDNVIVIGDSENDYDSICWAGTAVAMGNASDMIKDKSDYITGSNEEDGVAQALEALGLV